MATLLEQYNNLKTDMTAKIAEGKMPGEQMLAYQEVLYRICVLETCQGFCKSAPVSVDAKALTYHYQLSDGYIRMLLADYPAHTLHPIIPHFHDTVRRYEALERAAAADASGRAGAVARELAFARARRAELGRLVDAQQRGELPLRVTHNDTKLNNVLLDKTTGKAICVIDLDTVMPGAAANDFGDAIRFGANHCAEDEPDLSLVQFSLPLYETYTEAYLDAVGDALTDAERASLPWGARLMTLECGMRFLTDHLEGDRYFRISRPGQNLDRCRTQFKLVADMEACWDEMQRAVRRG